MSLVTMLIMAQRISFVILQEENTAPLKPSRENSLICFWKLGKQILQLLD